jgi:hypothetical protein
VCTCGVGSIYRITVAWSARRQSSLNTRLHMHVPFTCAHTSGVEIRGDCEQGDLRQELSSSSPRARAVRPSVVRHGCPQPTTNNNNWAPRAVTVVSPPKISDGSSLSRTGMAEERTRVCLSWMWARGFSRVSLWASRASTRHDVLSPCCVKTMQSPVRAPYTRYVSLVVAGTSPGWSVLLHRPLDHCLGALVSLGCIKTLSTSFVSYPSVWPP